MVVSKETESAGAGCLLMLLFGAFTFAFWGGLIWLAIWAIGKYLL